MRTVKSFDGAELHVEESGDPAAPLTVLLAHGWTLAASAWQAAADALATDAAAAAHSADAPDVAIAAAADTSAAAMFAADASEAASTAAVADTRAAIAAAADTPATIRILRYDQRGHGRSTRGADWHTGITGPYGRGPSIDQLARDLAAILAELVPTGPVVLGGHSMGGMTIMALADQHPELFGDRVVGVLLANTSAGGLHRMTLGLPTWVATPVRKGIVNTMRRTAARPEQADRIRARQRPDSRVAVAQTRWLLFGRDAPREVVVECNALIAACSSATLGGFFPALLSHEKHHALAALGKVPVEIAVGSRDRLTPVSHARRLAQGIPGARLTIVPDTGHMLPTEKPEAVTELLRSLISRTRSETSTLHEKNEAA